MEQIHVNMDVLLPSGYSEYVIDTQRDIELTFFAKEDSDVYIRIINAKKINIRTFAESNTNVAYLFWNAAKSEIHVDESHEVLANAHVTVAYGECNGAATMRNTFVALRQEGASALVTSASLVDCKKNYRMQVVNYAPHTYGDMKNYSVVLKTGELMIDAIGKVVKGARRSQSHQTSRALSFEKGVHATILPELLIDENDVNASHAMSIGRVDDDQLYYLMSRGLSVKQCTSLISTGYLMPITDTLNNDVLKEKLKEEMERKLNELC